MNLEYSLKKQINFDEKGIEKQFICEEFTGICEELTCTICMNLLYNPISCKNCDNMFCSTCIIEWNKQSTNCPNHCKFEPKPILFTIKNLLDKIKLKCINKNSGCMVVVYYKDFKSHMDNCEYVLCNCICSYCCYKKDFMNHYLNCKNILNIMSSNSKFYCNFCKSKILDEIDHVLVCPERKKECIICKVLIKNKDQISHFKEYCEGVKCMCKNCKKLMISFVKKEEVPNLYLNKSIITLLIKIRIKKCIK